MPTERRFVFDTNVLVSALLLKKSVARRAFDQARAVQFRIPPYADKE